MLRKIETFLMRSRGCRLLATVLLRVRVQPAAKCGCEGIVVLARILAALWWRRGP